MKFKISAHIGGVKLKPEFFQFPGGEYQVKIRDIKPPIPQGCVEVVAFMLNGDTMPLLLLMDAIKRKFAGNITKMTLRLPYLPYARQDRVMNDGESLAVKVFADSINSIGFDEVFVHDVHSDVGSAVINNCINVPQWVFVGYSIFDKVRETDCLVVPDAGASKRCLKFAQKTNISYVVRADKVRSVETGEITGTEVYGDVTACNCLITDDICDGGRTFIELAKVLKERGAKSITLLVTHGIFSKGKGVFDGLIDEVIAIHDYEEMFK